MKGYRFLRQCAILNYIVDFFCKDLMLVIELDGFTHDEKVKEDSIRDKKLNEEGYQVLRILDKDLFENIENVIRQIDYTVEKIASKMKRNEP